METETAGAGIGAAGVPRVARVALAAPPDPLGEDAQDAAAAAAGEAMELALLACTGRRPVGLGEPPERPPEGGRTIMARHADASPGELEQCAAIARSAWLQACVPNRPERLRHSGVHGDVIPAGPGDPLLVMHIGLQGPPSRGSPEEQLRGRVRRRFEELASAPGVSPWPGRGRPALMLLTSGGWPRGLGVLRSCRRSPLVHARSEAVRLFALPPLRPPPGGRLH